MEYLYEFHKENLIKKKVSCCITGVTEIYDRFCSEGLPCIRTIATSNIILMVYNKLLLQCLAQKNQESQIVVLAVHIDLPNEYSIERGDDYIYLLNRMKISEKVYMFGDRIDAAVVENNDKDYLLFTTKMILEAETNNLEDIYLLDLMKDITENQISVGIGYGKTAREAKYNAYAGIKKSQGEEGNAAYAVYGNHQVRGPLNRTKQEKLIIDKGFLEISKKIGISTATLYKIYVATAKLKKAEFTSKELAGYCKMSNRNMDRVLQKLENFNYCEVVGERMMAESGRPSRIIRIKELCE